MQVFNLLRAVNTLAIFAKRSLTWRRLTLRVVGEERSNRRARARARNGPPRFYPVALHSMVRLSLQSRSECRDTAIIQPAITFSVDYL